MSCIHKRCKAGNITHNFRFSPAVESIQRHNFMPRPNRNLTTENLLVVPGTKMGITLNQNFFWTIGFRFHHQLTPNQKKGVAPRHFLSGKVLSIWTDQAEGEFHQNPTKHPLDWKKSIEKEFSTRITIQHDFFYLVFNNWYKLLRLYSFIFCLNWTLNFKWSPGLDFLSIDQLFKLTCLYSMTLGGWLWSRIDFTLLVNTEQPVFW